MINRGDILILSRSLAKVLQPWNPRSIGSISFPSRLALYLNALNASQRRAGGRGGKSAGGGRGTKMRIHTKELSRISEAGAPSPNGDEGGEGRHRCFSFDDLQISLECETVFHGTLLGKDAEGKQVDHTGLLIWPGKEDLEAAGLGPRLKSVVRCLALSIVCNDRVPP
jgi:hypothetical protein